MARLTILDTLNKNAWHPEYWKTGKLIPRTRGPGKKQEYLNSNSFEGIHKDDLKQDRFKVIYEPRGEGDLMYQMPNQDVEGLFKLIDDLQRSNNGKLDLNITDEDLKKGVHSGNLNPYLFGEQWLPIMTPDLKNGQVQFNPDKTIRMAAVKGDDKKPKMRLVARGPNDTGNPEFKSGDLRGSPMIYSNPVLNLDEKQRAMYKEGIDTGTSRKSARLENFFNVIRKLDPDLSGDDLLNALKVDAGEGERMVSIPWSGFTFDTDKVMKGNIGKHNFKAKMNGSTITKDDRDRFQKDWGTVLQNAMTDVLALNNYWISGEPTVEEEDGPALKNKIQYLKDLAEVFFEEGVQGGYFNKDFVEDKTTKVKPRGASITNPDANSDVYGFLNDFSIKAEANPDWDPTDPNSGKWVIPKLLERYAQTRDKLPQLLYERTEIDPNKLFKIINDMSDGKFERLKIEPVMDSRPKYAKNLEEENKRFINTVLGNSEAFADSLGQNDDPLITEDGTSVLNKLKGKGMTLPDWNKLFERQYSLIRPGMGSAYSDDELYDILNNITILKDAHAKRYANEYDRQIRSLRRGLQLKGMRKNIADRVAQAGKPEPADDLASALKKNIAEGSSGGISDPMKEKLNKNILAGLEGRVM